MQMKPLGFNRINSSYTASIIYFLEEYEFSYDGKMTNQNTFVLEERADQQSPDKKSHNLQLKGYRYMPVPKAENPQDAT